MGLHVTVLVVKYVEGNGFTNKADQTLTDSFPQQPSTDSRYWNSQKSYKRDSNVNRHEGRLPYYALFSDSYASFLNSELATKVRPYYI